MFHHGPATVAVDHSVHIWDQVIGEHDETPRIRTDFPVLVTGELDRRPAGDQPALAAIGRRFEIRRLQRSQPLVEVAPLSLPRGNLFESAIGGGRHGTWSHM